MSPSIVSVAPPPVVWAADVAYPINPVPIPGPMPDPDDRTLMSQLDNPLYGGSTGTGWAGLWNRGTVGGAGVTKEQARIGQGTFFRRLNTTSADAIDAWSWWGGWKPIFVPATWAGPDDPESRLAWWRVWLANTAGQQDDVDGAGVSFIPDAGQGVVSGSIAPAFGGFGVFVNAAGSGQPAGSFRYASYSGAPALLEAIQLPPSPVGSVDCVDVIVRNSIPGGAAPWLTLRWNGIDVITERPFGDPLLADPTAITASAVSWMTVAHAEFTAATGAQLYYRWRARFGRFHPDGFPV